MNWDNVKFKSSVSTNESDMKHIDLDLAEEEDWLKSVNMCLGEQEAMNISWGATHASKVRSEKRKSCITSLLPHFSDDSKSSTMIKHGLDIICRAVKLLNPSQTPVITMNELYCKAAPVASTTEVG